MHIAKSLPKFIFACCALAINIVGNDYRACAISSQPEDSASAISDWNRPLKTKISSAEEKHAPKYILELQTSQTVKPIGNEPVSPVEQPAPINSQNQPQYPPNSYDKESVSISTPPLKALVSVQENINPFSLDATFIEPIELEDALRSSFSQNLNIENSFSQLRIQKYAFLAAASKFLPDINSGYNLIGLHGSFPASLLGISSGVAAASTGGSIHLPSAAQVLSAGFTYHAYQGGKVLFSTLEERHRLRAAHASLKGSINDTLLETVKCYYDLVLNESFLTTRTRTVAISAEQVRLNSSQEKNGLATGLDVLQSQAQLASDEQNLVDQQQARRHSAIQLASNLNASFAQDLVTKESDLEKRRLIRQTVPITDLLKLAIDYRPELKQYEELRLAAKRAIVVAGAPLQPKINLGGSIYGIGAQPTLGNLSSIFVLNFSINWTLGALGTTDLANIQGARWQARQSAIQAKQTFQSVFEQVRDSYNQILAADKRIDHSTVQTAAAEEELKIAKKRMEAGIGLNIDVLNAQRDLTQAQINKAQAIADFNVAQAQLLHDIGLISIDTLIHGAHI